MISQNESAQTSGGRSGAYENTGASTIEFPPLSYQQASSKVKMFADEAARFNKSELCEILAIWLVGLRAGMPVAAFETIESEADSWAELANPVELQMYQSAICKRLEHKPLSIKSRKKLFWGIWTSFLPSERTAFLKRVSEVVI